MRAETGRDVADFVQAMLCVEESLYPEVKALFAGGKVTRTTVMALARIPQFQQRAMFEKLNTMGARAAKRYVEQLHNPPTVQTMTDSLLAFLLREYPAQDAGELAATCAAAATVLRMCEADQDNYAAAGLDRAAQPA